MKAKILNRKLHRWAAIVTALPVVIVIISGMNGTKLSPSDTSAMR